MNAAQLAFLTQLAFLIPPTEDYPATIRQLKEGIPFDSVEELQRVLGVSNQSIAELAGISSRTLARRKVEKRLTQEEGEKVLRLMRVTQRALELFEGDLDAARRWLNAPDSALEGRTPLQYADTYPGYEFTMRYIGRLEHGIPT